MASKGYQIRKIKESHSPPSLESTPVYQKCHILDDPTPCQRSISYFGREGPLGLLSTYHPNCSQCSSTPGPSPRIKLAVTSLTVVINPAGPHAATSTRPVAGVDDTASRIRVAVSGRPGLMAWPWLYAVSFVLVELRVPFVELPLPLPPPPVFSGSEDEEAVMTGCGLRADFSAAPAPCETLRER